LTKSTTRTRTPSTAALSGDAAAAVGILTWAQDAGVDVSELTVGAVSIKLRGVAAQGQDDRDGDRGNGRPTLHEEFGRELFQQAVAEKVIGTDLQPAIGRRAG
jgi:hypothetical protein